MNKEKLRFNANHYEDSLEGLDLDHLETEGPYERVPTELARELGSTAVSLARGREAGIGLLDDFEKNEAIKGGGLEEMAIKNLTESNGLVFSPEEQQGVLDLLRRQDEQSVDARRVVSSVLADDLLVNYMGSGYGSARYQQYRDEGLVDLDMASDTRSQLLEVARYVDDEGYSHRVKDLSRFLAATEGSYTQAVDSGYPEILLATDRLAVFSKYAGNNTPFGEHPIDYNITKSCRNFEVAVELGESAASIFNEDRRIASRVLGGESYRRAHVHNYDPLTREGCELIAGEVRSIKMRGESESREGLEAVAAHVGQGLGRDVHMLRFAGEVIGSDVIASLKSDHGNLVEGLINMESDRVDRDSSSQSVIVGIEEFVGWIDESGYDRKPWTQSDPSKGADFDLVDASITGIARSSHPESLVDTFRSLEFIDKLTNNTFDTNEEYRGSIIRGLMGVNGETLLRNPSLANEAYSLYDSQLDKQEMDFSSLYRIKGELSRDFMHLNEEYRGRIDSHFNKIYSEYINRTDKDGNRFDSAATIYSAVCDSYLNREGGHSPELLEWFESSNRLPMIAYQSVSRMREMSLERGVDDNPDAVHEFIYSNPEMVRESSNVSREAYLRKLAAVNYNPVTLPGAPVDARPSDEALYSELSARAERDAERRSADFRTFINLSEEALRSVAGGGMQLKSMLDSDTGTVRGGHYIPRRSGVEIALGIRSIDSDDSHPIYGSAGFIDRGYPDGAWGYGEVMLVFNDEEMNSRSTFTSEDSFHGVGRLTREDAMKIRAAKDICGLGHTMTSDYVEAQVKGSVDIAKVEVICVEDSDKANSLKQFLPDELHDKITVRRVAH